jgi:hypothetical protein
MKPGRIWTPNKHYQDMQKISEEIPEEQEEFFQQHSRMLETMFALSNSI